MDRLINTDLGLISDDNANYLFKQGMIDREGKIVFKLINGLSDNKVQLYSYFRWLIDDIKEKIPTTPKQVKLTSEDFITTMRTGNISVEYTAEDKNKYHYIAKYPIVESIERSGKKAYVENNNSKSTKKNIIDEDF